MRRVIGMDIHRTFAEVVFWEDGRLRPHGQVDMTRSGLEGFARGLTKEDEVVVEATGNAMAVGRVLSPYQPVEETRLQSGGSGWPLTTSIAASVPVATTRMAAVAPSAAASSSRCADARTRNSLGVPAPTRRRMIRPRS